MILREIILKCSLPDVTVGNIVNIWLSFMLFFIVTEAVSRRGSVKKVFLKISQNSQEKTRAKLFFCEFCKNLFTEQPRWLLLLWNYEYVHCLSLNFAKLWKLYNVDKHIPKTRAYFMDASVGRSLIKKNIFS